MKTSLLNTDGKKIKEIKKDYNMKVSWKVDHISLYTKTETKKGEIKSKKKYKLK